MREAVSNIITLDRIHVGYDAHVLLRDIHVQIPASSIMAILGMNGTGKSTLLRTICGLQPAISGEVQIHGQSIRTMDVRELAKQISIVLTGRGEMVPSLFVYELLAMARAPHQHWLARNGEDDNKVVETSATIAGVTHLLDRRLYTLSDGEMQLVAIARAIAQETPVIVLDEPTSHLDILHKLQVFGLMRTLASHGKTIIFTSHEIDMALAIADHALLIDKQGNTAYGEKTQLVAEGTPEKFFASPDLTFDRSTGRFHYTL